MSRPVNAVPPLPYPGRGSSTGELAAFDQDLTRALHAYLSELARRTNENLPKDGSEAATLLRISNNTDISSLTQLDQPLQIGDYIVVNMMIDGNEIQVRNNGAADTLNLNLLGGHIRFGPGDIVLDGGVATIRNIANNQAVALAGGSGVGNGANIELYGGTHATEANNAYYDAATHTFRVQNGSAQNAISVAGIQFPASQIASGDANRLDDYEEGTWTPVLTFSTPGDLSVAYSTQTGTYLKIGQLVWVKFVISTSTFTHTTASGELRVDGLPFTSLNAGSETTGPVEHSNITFAAGRTHLNCNNPANTVYARFIDSGSATTRDAIDSSEALSGTQKTLVGSLVYRATA